ncbi:TlpA family protein disulfide reductase [Niabella aquatica]
MQGLVKIIVLLLFSIPAQAQFRLSGKIERFDNGHLFINIPFVFGYYKENNIPIPVKQDGSFGIDLPIQEEKFATLNYNRQEYTLYLKPGETLHVQIDSSNKYISPIRGSLYSENKILTDCAIDEYPWFLKAHLSKDSTAKLKAIPAAIIYEKFIQPWLAQNQQKEKIVLASTLPEPTKQLFIQEIKAKALCHANNFAWSFMDSMSDFYKLLYGNVSPKSTVRNPGPMYYTFIRYYIGFLDAMVELKIKDMKPTEPLPYYNISLDSGKAIVNKKGKAYINWLAVKNTNDAFVAEAFLAQQLFATTNEKELAISRGLLAELKSSYPHSPFYKRLSGRVNELETMLSKNLKDENIRIFDNYKAVQSIYPVIHSLKGKVVYLDVWGTWCGPCKAELQNTPKLKEHFKNKEVAFVYLDMDDDEKDSTWKEYIRINELHGIHLRKNNNDIEPFWKELLENAPDKERYYPQYFIFDRTGKLVIPKAKRPGEGEALYKQLEEVLERKEY